MLVIWLVSHTVPTAAGDRQRDGRVRNQQFMSAARAHGEDAITVLEGGGRFCKPAPIELPGGGPRLQLFRPGLVLPSALPVLSIWGRGRGYQTSVHQTQLEPVFSAMLSGHSLFLLADTQSVPGVHRSSRQTESLCHLASPCRERGCGISREHGLCSSSQLLPLLHRPPSPVPQIQATDADISKYSVAQRGVGKAGRRASPTWGHSTAAWPTTPCIAPGRWLLGLNEGCKRTLSIHVLDGSPLVAMHAFSI